MINKEYSTNDRNVIIMPANESIVCVIDDVFFFVPARSVIFLPKGKKYHIISGPYVVINSLFFDDDIKSFKKEIIVSSTTPLIFELILFLSSNEKVETLKFKEMLIELINYNEKIKFNIKLTLPKDRRLKRIMFHILKYPEYKNTMKNLSCKFGVGERTLLRVVNKELFMSFSQWKKQIYIYISLKKLYSGSTIQQISDELGYESVSSFICFFKKNVGTSPKKYLKKNYIQGLII